MALPLSNPQELAATSATRNAGRAVAVGFGAAGALIMVATLALWVHYGTAVFFETIAAGIAGCF
jgi:hypothetical protein